MFCSRAFAFMALILLKTRTLCKMHNTQKIYVGNTNKKNEKKTEKSDSTIAQRLFFSDFIFVILLFFCLCCKHKFKIIMYLVSKFKFSNISLENIQRKSHKITKNQHRIRGKKYTNLEKGILHQSTSLPSP